MKKSIVVILLAIGVSSLFAQNKNKLSHRYGVAVDGGWSQLSLNQSSNNTNVAPPVWGWFGGGELVCEVKGNLWLLRSGIGIDYSSNWNLFDAPGQSRGIEEYPAMTYHYDFSNFRQHTSLARLRVPIMSGHEFKTWYFLLGGKLGFCPYATRTKSYVDAHVWGTDADVIDPMEGLNTHDIGNFHFAGETQKLILKSFTYIMSAEVGLCLGKQARGIGKRASSEAKYKELRRKKTFAECTHYKVALFADYDEGRYDYQPNAVAYQTPDGVNAEGGLIDIPQANRAVPYSIFGYEPNKNAFLSNLFVGLRLAIMYEPQQAPPTTGNMAYPHIITVVSDGITGEVLSGATVQMCGINPKNKKPQIFTKATGGKDNIVERACPAGKYDFNVTYPGYLPFDTVGFEHGEEFDTLFVMLYKPHDLTVNVIDHLTGEPISSRVVVHDQNGNSVSVLSLDSGMVDTMTLSTGLSYQFCATSKGYIDTCYIVTREHNNLTIELTRVPQPPRKFVLKAMYFATDKSVVLPISEKPLADLYAFLEENPEVKIRIIGHTDDVASDEYNQGLSERRANSVKNEMVKRGIAAERMETQGKGESEPIVPNESDGNRQMNRRVEIELVSGEVRFEFLREIFKDSE